MKGVDPVQLGDPGPVTFTFDPSGRDVPLFSVGTPPEEGGLWSGPKVAAWIAAKTAKRTHPQLGWVYLHRLGMSGQVPRRKHHRAATAQERWAFKKS